MSTSSRPGQRDRRLAFLRDEHVGGSSTIRNGSRAPRAGLEGERAADGGPEDGDASSAGDDLGERDPRDQTANVELGEVMDPTVGSSVGALDQADGAKRVAAAEGHGRPRRRPGRTDAPNVAAATMRDDEGGDDRRDRADEDRDRGRRARGGVSMRAISAPAEDGAEDEPEQDAPHRGADHVVHRGVEGAERWTPA